MTTTHPTTTTDAAEAFAALAQVRECLRISEIEGQQANARTAELILQERAEDEFRASIVRMARDVLKVSESEAQRLYETDEFLIATITEESAAHDRRAEARRRREEQAEWHAAAETEAQLIHLASALANLTLQPRSRAVRIQIDALAGAILTMNA